MRRFTDRDEAGRRLAQQLTRYANENPLVLALPRGGVPVGYQIARALGAPLDVCVVRKVGVPWHQELGLGAVAEGGTVYLTPDVLEHIDLSQHELERAIAVKRREVEERVERFRGGRPLPQLTGHTVILVDDGIATGGTVRAAIRAVRNQGPKRLVLAVPVAAPQVLRELGEEVDDTVCLLAPPDLYAIGLWYEDFRQVSDDEVAQLLDAARAGESQTDAPGTFWKERHV